MLLSQLGGVSSVAFRHRSGEVRPLVGRLMNQIEVDKKSLYLPAGSFFQTNLEMLSRVIARMRDVLSQRETRRAADVYGGVGVLGLSLLDMVQTLTLIELDSLAIEAARKTAEEWRASNVAFINGHVETALPSLRPQDVVIVDPPRSGLGEAVTTAIAHNSPVQVLYLSCSPSSLASDLAQFQRVGYGLRSLEIFDFYPQTFHVESLAVLERWT
jgi:23S rRNA (uracil1939-C5)-methyltransferase